MPKDGKGQDDQVQQGAGQQQGQQDQGDAAGQQQGTGTDATDWKAEARKWEDRAKANVEAARKLADIEAASQTAQERAEAAAKAAEDRAQAAVLRIASAEVRAALTGVVPDPSAVAEDLDLSKFVTGDGEVDAAKVAALKTKYTALAPAGARAPAVNPAQGAGGHGPTFGQLVADAEKARNPRESIRLKSKQLLQLRNQG